MKLVEDIEYNKLLRLVSKGDTSSFTILYDLFWSDLLTHILTKVSDLAVAEDIIHDIFVSLWNKREKIEEIESIPAYLFSAARYKIFSHYRKQELIKIKEKEYHLSINECSYSVDDRLYYRYLLDIVSSEIENLPEKCREVFKLSRFSYLTNKEISERLGVSESTVENHINKALRRLKKVLDRTNILFQLFL